MRNNNLKFLVLLLIIVTNVSCKRLYQFPSISKLSTSVLVGLDKIPQNIKVIKRPSYETLNVWETIQLHKQQKIRIWTYAVSQNIYNPKNKFTGINNLDITLDVVDEFGNSIGSNFITTKKIRTDHLGYNQELVEFISNKTGVYRIKANYLDNNIYSVSYSPPIIVID